MSLLSLCKTHFNVSSLYDVLQVDETATEDEIKRSYRKQALCFHPDRVEESEKKEATVKFQILAKVNAILSNPDTRATYNELGEVDEDGETFKDVDWANYWKNLFPKISEEDIVKFEFKYKGSDEELNDVKDIYENHKGDMDKILECVLCCTIEDEPRFREMIIKAIDEGELKPYDKFTKESRAKKEKRIKKFQKEAEEAKNLSENNVGSLRLAIQKRQETRGKDFDEFVKRIEDNSKPKGRRAARTKEVDETASTSKTIESGTKRGRKKPVATAVKNVDGDESSDDNEPVRQLRGSKPKATGNGKAATAATAVIPEPTKFLRSDRRRGKAETVVKEDDSDTEPQSKSKRAAVAVKDTSESENEVKPKRTGRGKASKPNSDAVEDTEVVTKSAPKRVAKPKVTNETKTDKDNKETTKKRVLTGKSVAGKREPEKGKEDVDVAVKPKKTVAKTQPKKPVPPNKRSKTLGGGDSKKVPAKIAKK